MAQSIKISTKYHNPYEEDYYKLKGTKAFNQTTWDEMYFRDPVEFSSYLSMMYKQNEMDLDAMNDRWSFNRLDPDTQVMAMYAATYADNTKLNKYKITTGYDDQGKPIQEEREWTEYQYYDYLLQEGHLALMEQDALDARKQAKEDMSTFTRLMNDIAATGGEFLLGAAGVIENTVNLIDAIAGGVGEFIGLAGLSLADPKNTAGYPTSWSGIWNAVGNEFRERLSDDEVLPGFKEVVDETLNELREWEKDNTGYMTVDGERTFWGKVFGDAANSIGAQVMTGLVAAALPGVGLSSKAAGIVANVGFYSSFAEQGMQERFRDERFASVATGNIIAEAGIQAGLEFAIEKGLGKLFGTTGADLARGVTGTGKGIAKGFGKYMLDAVQESAEEVLQEFSGWAVSNAMGLIEDEFRTDITAQQFLDAAIGGFVGSLVMGGFQILSEHHATTSGYKYQAKSNLAYYDLKTKAERKQFIKGYTQFAKARDIASQLGVTKYEYNAYAPAIGTYYDGRYGYGLGAVAQVYQDVSKSIDPSTKAGQKTMAKLNMQLYSGYKIMMGLYGSFGTERAAAAEKLLNDMTTYSQKTEATSSEIISKTKKYAETLNKEVSTIYTERTRNTYDEQFNKLLKDAANYNTDKTNKLVKDAKEADSKTTKKKRGRPKKQDTEVKKDKPVDKETEQEATAKILSIFDTDNEMFNGDEVEDDEVVKTAKELATLYEADLVLWDNHAIVEQNGTIFAPNEAVKNLPALEIVKAGIERNIVHGMLKYLPKNVVEFVIKEYTDTWPKTESEENDDVRAMYELLFNQAFYQYLLNRGNIEVFNVLKSLDNIATEISNMEDAKLRTEYYKAIRRIRTTIGPVLAMFFCNNPKLKYDKVTVFTDAQIQFIEEHRLHAFAYNILVNDINNPDYDKYANALINAINASNQLDADEKKYFRKAIEDKDTMRISQAYSKIDNDYYNRLYGEYNDVDYVDGNDVKSALFNSFLKNTGIKIRDIVSGNLPTEMITEFNSMYDTNNLENRYKYISYKFTQYTNGDYSVILVDKRKLSDEKTKELKGFERKVYYEWLEILAIINDYIVNDKILDADIKAIINGNTNDTSFASKDLTTKLKYESAIEYLLGNYTASSLRMYLQFILPNVEIDEIRTYQEKDYTYEYGMNNVTTQSVLSRDYVDTSFVQGDVTNYIREYTKIDDIDAAYITFEDIVSNPYQYLTDDTLKEIRKQFKVVNKTTAMLYLRNKIINESSHMYTIVMTADGKYIPALVIGFDDFYDTNLLTKLKDYGKLDKIKNLDDVTRPWPAAPGDVAAEDEYIVLKDLYNKDGKRVFKAQEIVSYDDIDFDIDYYTLSYDEKSKNEDFKSLGFVDGKQMPITDLISKDKIPKALQDVTVSFYSSKEQGRLGAWSDSTMTIMINLNSHTGVNSVLSTILHEFQHAYQSLTYLAPGSDTQFSISFNDYKDIKKHVPNITTKEQAVRYLYEASSGEQTARGTQLQYTFVSPVLHVDGTSTEDEYFLTPWGSKIKAVRSSNNLPKTDIQAEEPGEVIVTKLEGKRKKSFLAGEKGYNDAKSYVQRIDDALEIISLNKKNNVKTYKKDLKHLHLPAYIVTQLVEGNYQKQNDQDFLDAKQAIRTWERKQVTQQRRQRRVENKESDRPKQLFQKRAEGTNLKYWLVKNPDVIPYIHPAVQEFVLATPNLTKLPKELREAIKNATLTYQMLRNFVREHYDDDVINEYTFDGLKQSLFKKTPFKSFADVKMFIKKSLIEQAYGIKSVFENDEKSHELLFKQLEGKKTPPEKFIEKIVKTITDDNVIKEDAKSYKNPEAYVELRNKQKALYGRIIAGFNTYWKVTGDKKKTSVEIDMSDTDADTAVALLEYYDGTIDSLAYVAGNMKRMLIREVEQNMPFTYKNKKDVAKQRSTVSIDATIGGSRGHESNRTLAETIQDEKSRIDDDDYSVDEVDADLKNHIRNYVLDIIQNLNVKTLDELNKAFDVVGLTFEQKGKSEVITQLQTLAKRLMKQMKTWSREDAKKHLAMLNTMDTTGMTFEEAFGGDLSLFDIDLSDTTVTIEDDDAKKKLYKERRKQVYHRLYDCIKYLNKSNYKYIPNEYKQYFVLEEGKFKVNNTVNVEKISDQEFEQLLSDLSTFKSELRSGYYANRQAKTAAEKAKKEIEKLKRKNKKLEDELKERGVKQKTTYTFEFETGESISSDKEPPAILKKLFNVTFNKETVRKMQFYAVKNERDVRVSMKTFFEENAETFNAMTYDDAVAIMDYFDNAVILNEIYTPYQSFQMFTLGYIIEQLNDRNGWVDTKYIRERAEKKMSNLVKNASRVFDAWRGMMKRVNPKKVITNRIMEDCGITLPEEHPAVIQIVAVIKSMNNTTVNNTGDPEYFKQLVARLKQAVKNLERATVEHYLQEIEKGKSPLKIFGKEVKINGKNKMRVATRIAQERILKFQKAMMLSAPATWVRNKFSNWILGGFNTTIKGKHIHIGGLNDASDVIGRLLGRGTQKLFKKKSDAEQYDLATVKVEKDTMQFCKDWLVDNGLLDLVSDGLSKFDTRKKKNKTGTIEDVITQMVVDSVSARVINEHTYGKGKVTEFLERKTGKKFEHGVMDNIVNFIFARQSDKTDIQSKALKYIGKMLQVNKVDLSQGVTTDVMRYIADGYTMAAWEYMHRGNFVSDWIHSLRNKHPRAYFCLNIIEPFVASSWNWFTEMLQMNPVALAVNIKRLLTLERTIDDLDERRRRGDYTVPDSRFAQMLVYRNIGKGVVGTLLILVGAGLKALGKIEVDEKDETPKWKIGNTYIDFSNIFGSSALLVGSQLVNPDEGTFWTILESTVNQQFEDSFLSSIMNTFKYDNSPYAYLTSLPTNVISGFIPNMYKSFVRATNNHTVDYGKRMGGIEGDLQYLAIQTIPAIEYVLPKGIDPYTGEWEAKYSIPAVWQLASAFGLPISIKSYDISDIEAECMAVGKQFGELSGEYKDIGKLDKTKLNEFYGKLNNKVLTDFINGKTTREVENEQGRRVKLYYNQMTMEQKKSALTSIASQNAEYAKIYVWTQSGHKYYCSKEMRSKLLQAGITENIYIGNKGYVN